jgi:uncharacterized membrane protein YjjB (DUF3815 family)
MFSARPIAPLPTVTPPMAEHCISAPLSHVPDACLAAAAGLVAQYLSSVSLAMSFSVAAALGRAAAAARSYQLDRRWRGYCHACM